MPFGAHKMQLFSLLIVVLALEGVCYGQIAGKEEKAPVIKASLPLIQCQVCQNLMREASRSTNKMKDEAQSGKLKEIDVMEFLENICDPESDAGNWIAKTDLQVHEDQLKLVDMEQVGDCRSECRSIARACIDLMEEIDMELAEDLFKGVKRAALTSKMCYSLSDACNRKLPPVPKDWVFDEEFKVLDEKEIEMRKLMKQMQDMGMGGQMYNREDLMDKVDPQAAQMGESETSKSAPKKPVQKEIPTTTAALQKGLEFGKIVYKKVSDAVGLTAKNLQKWLQKREEL